MVMEHAWKVCRRRKSIWFDSNSVRNTVEHGLVTSQGAGAASKADGRVTALGFEFSLTRIWAIN